MRLARFVPLDRSCTVVRVAARSIRGSRVLITGASRGIGSGIAREVASRGAHPILIARNRAALDELASELGHACVFAADLSETEHLADLVAAIEQSGPIDVLVNNAGVDLTGRFWELDPRRIEHLVRLNLIAPMLLCRAVLPGMLRAGNGHLVNVSSLAATNTLPGLVPYGSSKAGLSHFTACLRSELRGTPITTTLVQIGPVEGEMMAGLRAHPPTRRAVDRLSRLRLSFDLPMDGVVMKVVDAIERRRRHVVMPARDRAFPALVEMPRRMTEWLLMGVDHQSDEPASTAAATSVSTPKKEL